MSKGSIKKIIGYIVLLLLPAFLLTLYFANRYFKPVLRQQLHNLIIRGSDSLYTYRLGNLNVNILAGKVEVENLHIRIDSAHYTKLMRHGALPALTMEFDLEKGRIQGLNVFSLLLRRKIKIKEVASNGAHVQLTRHIRTSDSEVNKIPLWKALQPAIESIEIDRVRMGETKLLYKHADTSESVKLQFERCEALFRNIKVDSATAMDANRIAFAKNVSVQLYALRYVTPDSAYKIKADVLQYTSASHLFALKGFTIQSSLNKEEFFSTAAFQQDHYDLQINEANVYAFQLDSFINRNIISTDSIVIKKPKAFVSLDRTLPVSSVSKFGNYPHQMLLHSNLTFRIKAARIEDGLIRYTERGKETGKQGYIEFTKANILLQNITNDARLIEDNAVTLAVAEANVFDSSAIHATFRFYLNSVDGSFEAEGTTGNINAAQLNTVAEPLGNARLQSLQIQKLAFRLTGDQHSTEGNVQMRYSDLALLLRETDEETGRTKPKKMLNKLLSKFVIYPHNPADGVERMATDVVYARLSAQGFFAVIWKTIFFGMQDIMIKSGRYK